MNMRGRTKIAFEYAGYVFTVKEVVALVVALVVLVGSWFRVSATEVYRGLFALTMAAGAAVSVFVAAVVVIEKWVAASPNSADSRSRITGEAGVVIGAPVISAAGRTLESSPMRNAALDLLRRFGSIVDADPVQIAAYRQTHMNPSLIDARGGSEAGTPLPLRDEAERKVVTKRERPTQEVDGSANIPIQVGGDAHLHDPNTAGPVATTQLPFAVVSAGNTDHAVHRASQGMHPRLMDVTAKSGLPIGGVAGSVPDGLTRYGGKVTEWLGGEPIAGVMVFAEGQRDRAVRTDGWGEWWLDLTSSRPWTFHFEREDYEQPLPREGTPIARQIDVQLKRSAAPDARIGAPMAMEHSRVSVNAMDNGASEVGVLWFHLRAFTTTSVLAKRASVRVRVSAGAPERWLWAGAHEFVNLGQQGHEIPLVVGHTSTGSVNLRVGWSLSQGTWHITPDADGQLGRQVMPFGANAAIEFDVTVSWEEGNHEAWTRATFELHHSDSQNDVWLQKTGEKPSLD